METELNSAVSRLRSEIDQLCAQFGRGAQKQTYYFETVTKSDAMSRLDSLKTTGAGSTDGDRVAQAMSRVDEAMKVAGEAVKSGGLGDWIRSLLRRAGPR